MRIFYLHGFASSKSSGKAAYFARRFQERGQTLYTPDLNEPDFSTLTIRRMINRVRNEVEAMGEEPVALIGSSLGAFVAVQLAVETPALVDRLVLLAPAVDLRPERLGEMGDRKLAEWKSTGTMNVYHYGYGRLMPLGYALYEDACGYDAMNAPVSLPIQVFQGRRDTAVDPLVVERWCRVRPNVELHMLDDDHQLMGSLDYIWTEMDRFLAADIHR